MDAASALTQKPHPPDQETPAPWEAEWEVLNCWGWGLLTLNL